MPKYLYDSNKKAMVLLEDNITVNISNDDKALLHILCEEVGYDNVSNYVSSINEEGYVVDTNNPISSAGHTPGTTEHGAKGFVKALPGLIVDVLICPPRALIKLVGALHERGMKRWLTAMGNTERMMDFISLPYEKRKELADKVKREMARETSYYMAKLANGEVMRVVACTTLEAKEMAIGIEKKILIPQEADNNGNGFTLLKHDDVDPTGTATDSSLWKVVFNDGEIAYWQGSMDAKDKVVKAAQKQREMIANAFAEQFKEVTKKFAKHEERLKGIGNAEDEQREPIKVASVEDAILVKECTSAGLFAITEQNKEDIEIIKADSLSVKNNSNYPIYKITIEEPVDEHVTGTRTFLEFNIPAMNDQELQKIAKAIFDKKTPTSMSLYNKFESLEKEKTAINKNLTNPAASKNISGPYRYVSMVMNNNDIITLYISDTVWDPMTYQGSSSNRTAQTKMQVLNVLKKEALEIEKLIYNAIVSSASKETINIYKTEFMAKTVNKIEGWDESIWDDTNASFDSDFINYTEVFDKVNTADIQQYDYNINGFEDIPLKIAI